MLNKEKSTIELILDTARVEFKEKGFKTASLRNIVKEAGVTTGAFYGYYKSKEELFDALVGEQYNYIIDLFTKKLTEFSKKTNKNPEKLDMINKNTLSSLIDYVYNYPEAFHLILCCSEGTKYYNIVDELVSIETKVTHCYFNALQELGNNVLPVDPFLEHILITGLFHSFFEYIIHKMPLEKTKKSINDLFDFYTAGWHKIINK